MKRISRISIFLIVFLILTTGLVNCRQATPEPPSVEPPVAPTEETETPTTPSGPQPVIPGEDEILTPTPSPTPAPLSIIEVEWESNGPEGNGIIECIFIADREGGILLATGYGNIWRSEDGGKSWLSVSKGTLCQTPIGRDPNHPDIMWIGTRNSATVYKSIDGGKTWKPTPTTGLGRTREDIFQGIGRLVVVDLKSNVWVTLNSKVYKSENGGETWSEITNLPPLQWKWKTKVVKQDISKQKGNKNIYPYKGILYESRDEGQTWTKVKERVWASLPSYYEETDRCEYETRYCRSFVCGVNSKGEVYIQVEAPAQYVCNDRLYKTKDEGKSWQECPLKEYTCDTLIWFEAKRDPNNENIILSPHSLGWVDLGDYGGIDWEFHLSFDGGKSWSKLNLPPGWKPVGNDILATKYRFDLISSEGTLKLFLVAKRVWQANLNIPK